MAKSYQDLFDSLYNERLKYVPAFRNIMPIYSPLGRLGINVNQNQSGSCYPFVKSAAIFSGLFADIDIQYPSRLGVKPPLYLNKYVQATGGLNNIDDDWKMLTAEDWLNLPSSKLDNYASDFSQMHTDNPQMVIVDSTGRTIIDTHAAGVWLTLHNTTVTQDHLSNSKLKTYFWVDRDRQFQVLVHLYRTANDLTRPFFYPNSFQAADGTLGDEFTPRTFRPSVNPIRLPANWSPNSTLPPVSQQLRIITDDSVMATVEKIDKITQIRFDAVLSEVSKVNNRIPIQTINGQSPSLDGNFTLTGDACYSISRSGTISKGKVDLEPAKLNIRNDCTVCCSCDRYIAAFNVLAKIAERINIQIEHINRQKSELIAIRKVYDDWIGAVRRNKLTIGGRSSCKELWVNAAITNTENEEAKNVILLWEFSGIYIGHPQGWASDVPPSWLTSATGKVMQFNHNTKQQVQLHGAWPFFWSIVPVMSRCSTDYYQIRFKFDICQDEPVNVLVSAYQIPWDHWPPVPLPIQGRTLGQSPGNSEALAREWAEPVFWASDIKFEGLETDYNLSVDHCCHRLSSG